MPRVTFLIFRRVFLQSILEQAFNIDDIPRIIFVKKYQFRKGGRARKVMRPSLWLDGLVGCGLVAPLTMSGGK
jgi:hypothetical protein